jgi:RimJ/RimL family protein N-acetyltransferase
MYAADYLAGYPKPGPRPFDPSWNAEKFIAMALEEREAEDSQTLTYIIRYVGDKSRIVGTAEVTDIGQGRVELGWRVAVDQRGKGYAKEIGGALAHAGLSSSTASVMVARVSSDNIASIKVAESIGMQRLGEANTPLDLRPLSHGIADEDHVLLGINSADNVPKAFRPVWVERAAPNELPGL